MRVAALYDIHGNLPALKAVLDALRREDVDQIVIGGDVLPGPMPVETLACLADIGLPVQFIQGNGDRVVLAHMAGEPIDEVPEQFRESIFWTASRVSPEQRRWLGNWPSTCRVAVDELGAILFCHATPRNDTECFTRLTATERLAPVFAEVTQSVVVCGHTHMQFDRMVGNLRVVNAGSVGMPFSQPRGAYWVLLGPDVQLRCTSYDFMAAADQIRQTRYPHAEELSIRYVLHPPTEAESLQQFEQIALS
jgi:putative phosphoesterase